MISLLAQSTPSADAIKSWIEIVVWLAGGIAAIAVARSHLSGKNSERVITPSPLIVQEHPGVVGQSEIDQIHGRIKRERMELEEKISALKAEDARLREKLDDEISELQARIDAIPQRVITLLRETKGLIG